MEEYSEMIMHRVAGVGSAVAEVGPAGNWVGTYSCHDVPTALNLTVTEEPPLGQPTGALKGVFHFKSHTQLKGATAAEQLKGMASAGMMGGVGPGVGTTGRLTAAGCHCQPNWAYKNELFREGACGNPAQEHTSDWCFIVAGTCEGRAAGGNWDNCPAKKDYYTLDEADVRAEEARRQAAGGGGSGAGGGGASGLSGEKKKELVAKLLEALKARGSNADQLEMSPDGQTIRMVVLDEEGEEAVQDLDAAEAPAATDDD